LLLSSLVDLIQYFFSRQITFHSFRRFVKTTISDLGYSDFSEWLIGHYGSTYWTKKDSEKAEIFRRAEPYLTFLNIPKLERQGKVCIAALSFSQVMQIIKSFKIILPIAVQPEQQQTAAAIQQEVLTLHAYAPSSSVR